jgi:hypothetical protein
MKKLALAALLLSFSLSALAANKKKASTTNSDVSMDVSVPLVASDVTREKEYEIKEPARSDLAISYTTWNGGNIDRSTGNSPSGFPDVAIPQIAIDRYGIYQDFGATVLDSDVGVSYTGLHRSGALTVSPGVASSVSQDLSISSLRLGAAYRKKGLFQPSAGINILPTWAASAVSALEPKGLSAWGVMGQLEAQVAWCPPFMRAIDSSGGGFGLGAQYNVGSISGMDLGGFALKGFARVTY